MTDRNSPSTTTAFNKLPIELNKAIAHYIETDQNIAAFRSICRATNHAVDGDNFSFWRIRYREKYALKEGTRNKDLRSKYQRRAKYLRWGTGMNFVRGHTGKERKVINILKELIIESFQGAVEIDEHYRPRCPNQVQLTQFVMGSKLLLNGRRPPPPKGSESASVDESLAAVRLMCAHFLFDLEETKNNVFAIEESQKAVYAPTNLAPIYIGEKMEFVNMEWALHCLNFFRHHMTDPDTFSLFDTMQNLDVSQKPSPWRGPLKSDSNSLSNCWKGTYAFLEHEPLRRLRRLSGAKKRLTVDDIVFSDLNVDDGRLQELRLDIVKDGQPDWPDMVKEKLQSRQATMPATARAQRSKRAIAEAAEESRKNIQLVGWGQDNEDQFYAAGWLHALPNQQEIPGWQRITFLKYYDDDLQLAGGDYLWAYEGVVLPGGRIILGRWWYASGEVNFDNDYSGPFILWAVDPEDDIASNGGLEEEEEDGA